MTFHEKPETYEEALENLTEENWHTARELIEKKLADAEAEVERLREEANRYRIEADKALRDCDAMELRVGHLVPTVRGRGRGTT